MVVVCMFVCVFGWGLVMRLMSGGREAQKAQEQHERTMMEETVTETGIQKTRSRSENGVTCKKRYAAKKGKMKRMWLYKWGGLESATVKTTQR